MYPVAIAMAFELLTYGLVIGLVYRRMAQKGAAGVYAALLTAMAAGRLVWGVAEVVLLGLGGKAFTAQAFLAGALLNAVPGIIVQLVLIPAVMAALQKAGALKNTPNKAFAERLRRKRSLFAVCGCIAARFARYSNRNRSPHIFANENNKSLQVQAF